MKLADSAWIGTSGWVYPHWRGVFYPEKLPQKKWLEYYVDHFRTVEINSVFYRLPSVESLKDWAARAPEGFLFAVKASRFITHNKKLKDPEQPIHNVFSRIETLGDRLGPVLFQLPPKWRVNADRLREFVAALPSAHRYAFEFRHESWFCDEIYEVLDAAGCAFCIYELGGRKSPEIVTGDFVYLRLHGPDETKYQGSYDDQTLLEWKEKFKRWARAGKRVYCYFDNDDSGYAVRNALTLQDMLPPRT